VPENSWISWHHSWTPHKSMAVQHRKPRICEISHQASYKLRRTTIIEWLRTANGPYLCVNDSRYNCNKLLKTCCVLLMIVLNNCASHFVSNFSNVGNSCRQKPHRLLLRRNALTCWWSSAFCSRESAPSGRGTQQLDHDDAFKHSL